MKRILALCMACMFLCSCSEVAAREAVSYRYIPEYNELLIEYIQYSDPDDGESYDVRKETLVHHPAVYEIQYRITYSSGKVAEAWETVTAEEYTSIVNRIRSPTGEE